MAKWKANTQQPSDVPKDERLRKVIMERDELKKEVDRLQATVNFDEKVVRHKGTGYITFVNDESGTKFYALCWDTQRKRIEMTKLMSISLFNPASECPLCKNQSQFY